MIYYVNISPKKLYHFLCSFHHWTAAISIWPDFYNSSSNSTGLTVTDRTEDNFSIQNAEYIFRAAEAPLRMYTEYGVSLCTSTLTTHEHELKCKQTVLARFYQYILCLLQSLNNMYIVSEPYNSQNNLHVAQYSSKLPPQA